MNFFPNARDPQLTACTQTRGDAAPSIQSPSSWGGRGGLLIEVDDHVQSIGIIFGTVAAAVIYGIVHDQITARICVEYFTIGHPRLIESDSPTVLGFFWGVVATWWVGLPLGFGLAVAARAGPRPKLTFRHLIRPVLILLGSMFAVATVAGLIGFTTSRWGIFYLLEPLASRVPAGRHTAFLTDSWAHSGSYLAGILGGVVLWIVTWRRRASRAINGDPGAPPTAGPTSPVASSSALDRPPSVS